MANPYGNFKFELEVEGFVRAGVSKITGLKHTVEVIEYREGADNETPRKLEGQSTFENIVLERGMTIDDDFGDWMRLVYNTDNVEGEQGDQPIRKTLTIYMKDKAGNRVVKFTVLKAWCCELEWPELDAAANDVAWEKATICNEGVREERLT